MDIKTESFGLLTQVVYDKAVGYIKSIGKRVATEFNNTVTYAVAAVYATGDASHVNKLLPLLALAKLEPMFRRTVVKHDLIPFAYDNKECQYVGKIRKGDRATMEVTRDGIPQWEIVLKAALSGELTENKTAKEYNLETRADAFMRGARKEGCSPEDINKALASARRKYPADSNVLTAQEQVLVKENVERLNGEVDKLAATVAAH